MHLQNLHHHYRRHHYHQVLLVLLVHQKNHHHRHLRNMLIFQKQLKTPFQYHLIHLNLTLHFHLLLRHHHQHHHHMMVGHHHQVLQGNLALLSPYLQLKGYVVLHHQNRQVHQEYQY